MTEQRFRQIIREELQRAGLVPPEQPVSADFCRELAKVKATFAAKVAGRSRKPAQGITQTCT